MKATYVVILDDNTNNPKSAYFSDKGEALKSLESLQAKGRHVSLYVYES